MGRIYFWRRYGSKVWVSTGVARNCPTGEEGGGKTREPSLRTLEASCCFCPLGCARFGLTNAPSRTRTRRLGHHSTCQVTNRFPPARALTLRLRLVSRWLGGAQEEVSNQQSLLLNLFPLFPPPPHPTLLSPAPAFFVTGARPGHSVWRGGACGGGGEEGVTPATSAARGFARELRGRWAWLPSFPGERVGRRRRLLGEREGGGKCWCKRRCRQPSRAWKKRSRFRSPSCHCATASSSGWVRGGERHRGVTASCRGSIFSPREPVE